ncbi:LacI family DNA-binding transcriptional regulator [Maribacter sp. HTCC2170]|uniref:LacI family DNA-binding transcriptional regulator n=1 Tax=Maribacter sp. (strain HTCC2170 / KCCM 42371) TaxID=313603 RepID=UPI00006BD57B|nr:LacI family DNA-binding transcriptional regulator [Maribacter sp. HTCC2170]EAR02399.1 probable transcriptional regulator [Maribacter sp. HTCC2170]
MKKIFLKDIAEELKLSKTAVSLVLNNRGDENKISKETQKRILDFAKENNYRPNQMARGLSLGKSETIGLILPNISDIFYAKIAHYVEIRAKEYGYNVVFSSSNEDAETEKELIYSMLNRQVDGLIIASTQENEEDILKLRKTKVPFVLIDRHYPDIRSNYVIVDNQGGTRDMTEHLLNNGRNKIGLVTIESELEAMMQRQLGYEMALNDNGLEVIAGHIKKIDRFNFHNEMGKALKTIVQGENKVDALVFTTHYLAASGLRELKLLDIEVPESVAIISFDELGAFDLVDPPITASKQPVEAMGNEAVEILVNEIEKKNLEIDNERVLRTKLLIRKSCGA